MFLLQAFGIASRSRPAGFGIAPIPLRAINEALDHMFVEDRSQRHEMTEILFLADSLFMEFVRENQSKKEKTGKPKRK